MRGKQYTYQERREILDLALGEIPIPYSRIGKRYGVSKSAVCGVVFRHRQQVGDEYYEKQETKWRF